LARIIMATVLLLTSSQAGLRVASADGEPSEATQALADRAEVDPIDLQGALNTLGITDGEPEKALEYLYFLGELRRPQQSISGAVSRARCIINAESGGWDVPNRQNSGALGPGQYFPSTWARHVSVYRLATGYTGSLSLHNFNDVLRVMSYVLALPAFPHNYRGEWSVSGC
jgi:hypothetical protein